MARHREIRSLTGLRGLAAVYVVFFHLFPVLNRSNPFTRFLGHGYLAVDLFFVLSGFVMGMTYADMFSGSWNFATYRTFLGRRIARIFPLYLFASLVALFLILIGARHSTGPSLPVTLVSNFLMVQTWGIAESVNLPAWSISAEFAAYLLFPCLLSATLQNKRAWAWSSALAAATVLGILPWLAVALTHRINMQSPLDISSERYALPVFRCLAEFMLGLLSYRASTFNLGATLRCARQAATVLCLAILVLLATPRSDVVVVLLFPLLLVTLVVPDTPPSRILASPVPWLLGNLSYSIYLIQGLLVELLLWLNHRASDHGLVHTTRYVNSAVMLLIILLAWIVHRTIEVPARGWLRHVFEHGHDPPVTAMN